MATAKGSAVVNNDTAAVNSQTPSQTLTNSITSNTNDIVCKPSTDITLPTPPKQQKMASSTNPKLNNHGQGWRVKLYRLNADGSWDDCGTGRIYCQYITLTENKDVAAALSSTGELSSKLALEKNETQQINKTSGMSNSSLIEESSKRIPLDKTATLNENQNMVSGRPPGETPTPTTSKFTAAASDSTSSSLDSIASDDSIPDCTTTSPTVNENDELPSEEKIYSKLRNPILCMRAESDGVPKVLLNTRILLQDVYQRQGENIITWCEPCYVEGVSDNNGQNAAIGNEGGEGDDGNAANSGVDLALSFQDNAGCLDIWSQIISVQQDGLDSLRAQSSTAHKENMDTTLSSQSTVNNEKDVNIHPAIRDPNIANPAAGVASGIGTGSCIRANVESHIDVDSFTKADVTSTTDDLFPANGASTTNTSMKEDTLNDCAQDSTKYTYNCQSNSIPPQTTPTATSPTSPTSPERTSSPPTTRSPIRIERVVNTHTTAASDGYIQEEPVDTATAAVTMAAAAAAAYNGNTLTFLPTPSTHTPLEREPDSETESSSTTESFSSPGNNANPNHPPTLQLPHPPSIANLEEIADIIHAVTTCTHPIVTGPQNMTHLGLTLNIASREHLGHTLTSNNNAYFLSLLNLFHPLESRGDYTNLSTLAACIKSILFLNEPSILETVITDAPLFELLCGVLEYDPDLRDKANHRWYIRHVVKFRTVVKIEDESLIHGIHKCWRVGYLRDTVLRPTMEEGSLGTLGSLLHFGHAEVVRGVTTTSGRGEGNGRNATDEEMGVEESGNSDSKEDINMEDTGVERSLEQTSLQHHQSSGNKYEDCYLARVLRMLGTEIYCIQKMILQMDQDADSEELCASVLESTKMGGADSDTAMDVNAGGTTPNDSVDDGKPTVSALDTPTPSQTNPSPSPWTQHLSQQDPSLPSRRLRRRGCSFFLRELFVMVRTSLQQSAKDDFYAMICLMDVTLDPNDLMPESNPQTEDISQLNSDTPLVQQPVVVNLLQLLGAILANPTNDTTIEERSAALEIISSIAMHDPTLIRRHILEESCARPTRPKVLESSMVIFDVNVDDLLLSMLKIVTVETDAGLLLQTSEILRILLDTDVHNHLEGMTTGSIDNQHQILPQHELNQDDKENIDNMQQDNQVEYQANEGGTSSFLSLFYEYYVHWLVAPFQYTIIIPKLGNEPSLQSPMTTTATNSQMEKMSMDKLPLNGERIRGYLCPKSPPTFSPHDESKQSPIAKCAVRSSFTLELLCFCVRAHCYRMKYFVLRSKVLTSVLKLLNDNNSPEHQSDRCLKLAALRFLRSVVHVKDEFYHRHIVQYNLFKEVFDVFRANPVKDNLVSSSIIEMCDFIRTENLKTLLEYIVTKFLDLPNQRKGGGGLLPSLEDVATPYVDTFTLMRRTYEENKSASDGGNEVVGGSGREGILFVNGTNHGGDEMEMQMNGGTGTAAGGRYLEGGVGGGLSSAKALEDQRKFREVDEEESYFNEDDDDESPGPQPQQKVHIPLPNLKSPSTTTSATPLEDQNLPSSTSQEAQANEMQRARQFLGLCPTPPIMEHSISSTASPADTSTTNENSDGNGNTSPLSSTLATTTSTMKNSTMLSYNSSSEEEFSDSSTDTTDGSSTFKQQTPSLSSPSSSGGTTLQQLLNHVKDNKNEFGEAILESPTMSTENDDKEENVEEAERRVKRARIMNSLDGNDSSSTAEKGVSESGIGTVLT